MASNVLPDHRRYTIRPEHRGKPAAEPDEDWFKELVHNEIKMTKLYEEEVVKRREATARAMKMESKWNDLVDKYDVMNAERNSLRDQLGIKENRIADLMIDLEESLEHAENWESELNSLKDKNKIDKKAVKSAKKITKEYDMVIAERDSLKDEVDRLTKQRNEYFRILSKRKVKLVIKGE